MNKIYIFQCNHLFITLCFQCVTDFIFLQQTRRTIDFPRKSKNRECSSTTVSFITKERKRKEKERKRKESKRKKKKMESECQLDKHSNTLYIVCFRFRLLAAVLTDRNAIEARGMVHPRTITRESCTISTFYVFYTKR